ncbi:MAG: DNRLRE domain-containing protein [Ferruginibacter sp.]
MSRCYLIVLFVIISISTTKGQTTVDLFAAKDNTIYQNLTANSNGAGPNITSGNTSQFGPRRALIKFSVAPTLPVGATITSATLSLFCNKAGSTSIYNFSIFPLTADWGEGSSSVLVDNDGNGTLAAVNDATWLSRFHSATSWNQTGGDFNSTASATTSVGATSTSYTWASPQVIADVQNWLNNPSSNFGWILIGDETTQASVKRFGSRENTTVTQRPTLSITYTIAPVSIIYTFSGNGNWDVAANWSNNAIPPASLPGNDQIIIDPIVGGECILNVPQTILPDGKLTVQANKKFTIAGNLTIQ